MSLGAERSIHIVKSVSVRSVLFLLVRLIVVLAEGLEMGHDTLRAQV